jgi:subtilisin-like proprotein convertase family protein
MELRMPTLTRLAFLCLCLGACELDRAGTGATNLEDGGAGFGGIAGTGGWITGGVGGVGATGGVGGTGGVAGSSVGGTSGGGGSAGTPGDPCDRLCVDPNASCSAGGTCDCNSGFANTDTDGNPKTATCSNVAITGGKLQVGIGHAACGHLTLKLKSPDGTVLTLISRPGGAETADDGAGNLPGKIAGMDKAYPVTFDDTAATSSEDMGADFAGGTVCKNGTQICTFKPNAGVLGPSSFASAFAGKSAAGDWTLCVGDSFPGGGGKFDFWVLSLELANGPVVLTSPLALGVTIPDDGYNGTFGMPSMGCHTLTHTP